MTVDRKRLRELALAATRGWYYAGCWTVHNAEHHEVAHPTHEADAHFIAAANPQTILALLDALEAAEQPAPPMDDARDAARYRWLQAQIHMEGRAEVLILRQGQDWGAASAIIAGEQLDDAIDAAIAEQAKELA